LLQHEGLYRQLYDLQLLGSGHSAPHDLSPYVSQPALVASTY
jgi:hypothetical protein